MKEEVVVKILLSGASGLIGKSLQNSWKNVDWVRLEQGVEGWQVEGRAFDETSLQGIDAVIHLAGENVAKKRWSRVQKQKIKNSRVLGTKKLVEVLVHSQYQPKVVIAASAIGYYGDAGEMFLDETSPSGSGFLATVCREWEAAWQPLAQTDIRLVIARLGVVLSTEGGMLARMLSAFKIGLGGKLGDGRQYTSWVDIEDVAGAFDFLLHHRRCEGVFNVTAPHPVTNDELTQELGKQLCRPTFLSIPAFLLNLIFGERAKTLFLSSARCLPRHLLAMDFSFRYPFLPEALARYTHGKTRRS